MILPTVSSWKSTFNGHSAQDHKLDKFHNMLIGTQYQRIVDACADNAIAFMVAPTKHQILLLHHVHHDCGTPMARGSGDIWALVVSDQTAMPMIVPASAFHKTPGTSVTTIPAPSAAEFIACTNADEHIALEKPTDTPIPTTHRFRPNA